MTFIPEKVFVNSNGLTFGTSNGTQVTASVAAGAAQTHTAGTTNTAAGLSFSDANGVSFGLNGQTITASVAAGAAQTHTAGTTNTAAGLSFANGSGVSFGLNGQTLTASVAAQSVQPGIQSISAGTTRATTGEVVWANSNGISFGLDGQTVTASYTRPVVSNAIQAVGSASNSGTNTSRFAADDHVHAGINSVSVGGNTAGATTAGAGSLVLAGGPNVTLSCGTAAGGMTVSVSAAAPGGGVTLSGYENMPLQNAESTTFAQGLGTWHVQPFVVPQALASGRMNALMVSYSNTSAGVLRASTGSIFGSNTTGTASATYQDVWSAALYSRGAGANSTRLDRFWSNTWGLSLTRQVSVILTNATQVRVTNSASLSYVASVGSDGAYTLAGATSGGSTSSGASSMNTTAISSVMSSMANMLTGQYLAPMGFNTSIPAGHYWLAIARSTFSTSAGSNLGDQLPFVNRHFVYGLSSMPHRLFGLTVSNTSSQYWPGAGIYSAASSEPPATMEFTQIRSVNSHLSQYFNVVNITV